MYNVDPSVAAFDLERAMEETRAVREVNELTKSFVDLAVENSSSFNVVFNALANTAVALTFDYIVMSGKELNQQSVQEGVQLYVDTLVKLAIQRLNAVGENQGAANADGQENSQD